MPGAAPQRVWGALQDTEAPWLSEGITRVEAMRVSGLLERIEMVEQQVRLIAVTLDDATSTWAAARR